ncbi:MAG TPA: hypothetical protein DCE47_19510 [Planctomycetaceae bacterium]|nr:hypothetical protein [Planctomycetaceae bacterium]
MINWKEFQAEYELRDYRAALAVVAGRIDGVAVDGPPRVLRCRFCESGVEDREAVAGEKCGGCTADDALRWFCRNHPEPDGFNDANGCLCCRRGLMPLNKADSDLVAKVVSVCLEVEMLDSKGTLFEELKAAFRTGDEERAAEIYESGDLSGWAGAGQLVGLAKDSRKVVDVLEELESALKAGEFSLLVKIWDRHRKHLVVRTSGERYRDLVEEWRPKNAGASQVLDAWRRQPIDEDLLVKLWGEWRDRVADHPEILPVRQQVQRRVDQQVYWSRFVDVEQVASQETDEQRVSLWNDELFEDWGPARAVVSDVAAARQRLGVVESIRSVLEVEFDEPGPATDRLQQVVQLGGQLPGDYVYRDVGAVESAARQLELLDQLGRVVQEGHSDLAVVAAWRSLEGSGCGNLVEGASEEAVQRALAREELIGLLLSVPVDDLDVQECDRRLLEIWDPVLEGCPDLEVLQGRCELAGQRRQLLETLDAAGRDSDVSLVTTVAENQLLDHWPFTAVQEAAISTARMEVGCLDELELVVDRGDVERFAEIFDAGRLRRHMGRDSLEARRDQIVELVAAAVVPNHRNGLDRPFMGGVKSSEGGAVRVNWAWPDPRVSDTCRLRVCRQPEATSKTLSTEPYVFEAIVHRSVLELGDGAQPLPVQADWKGCQVIVQCLVDIGFATLDGEPLVLGILGE